MAPRHLLSTALALLGESEREGGSRSVPVTVLYLSCSLSVFYLSYYGSCGSICLAKRSILELEKSYFFSCPFVYLSCDLSDLINAVLYNVPFWEDILMY